MGSKRSCKHQLHTCQQPKGVALVAVLWLLVLLSLIAMHLSSVSRTEAQLSSNIVSGAQVRHAADAGVRWALWSLSLPIEQRWLADGSVKTMELDDTEINVALQDENGKIDINRVAVEQLLALFEAAEIDDQQSAFLVDAILDWRDNDDLKRLNGAEDDDYLAAGLDYGAKDALFESVEELKKVLGMDLETYQAISPALTVYSRKHTINPLVAPRLVLLSLPGATPERVDQYIEDRRFNHEEGLPPPQNPDFQAQFISPTLQGVYYTIHTQAANGPKVRSYLKVVIRRRGAAQKAHFELLKTSEEKEQLFIGAKP